MKQVVITKSGPPEVLQIRDAPDPIPRAGVWRLDADNIAQKFPIDGEQWATGIRDIDCLDWSPADAGADYERETPICRRINGGDCSPLRDVSIT